MVSGKKSSGVACCRFNDVTDKLEVLLVKKRYTYCFVSFVFGQYNRKDDKRLKLLFDGMTLQEKIDILSLRFELLWYKIWLEFPEKILKERHNNNSGDGSSNLETWKTVYKQKALDNNVPYNFNSASKLDFYIKKKNKFESVFLTDNGRRLRYLIYDTKNTDLIWEIPKGRKNKKETNMDCAIREFKEETGVGIESYNLMFEINPVVESYTSMNVNYTHSYYIAYTDNIFNPVVNFRSSHQIAEIGAIRWADAERVKYMDSSGYLVDLVDQIFSIFNLKYKHNRSL